MMIAAVTFALIAVALALPGLATVLMRAANNDPRPALSAGRGSGRSWRKFLKGFDHFAHDVEHRTRCQCVPGF